MFSCPLFQPIRREDGTEPFVDGVQRLEGIGGRVEQREDVPVTAPDQSRRGHVGAQCRAAAVHVERTDLPLAQVHDEP